MAADLRYTTVDVDFWYQYFLTPESDRPRIADTHIRRINPSKSELLDALDEAADWLDSHRAHPEWDGGALHLNFAGHGSENDGALILKHGSLHVDEYLEIVAEIAARVSPPGRLRISTVLDSCHSGAWVTRILDSCLRTHTELLVPFNLFASCMFDEFAWEDSSLGHGLFTYCMSVRPTSLGSAGAMAVLPDNSTGPSVAIAAGERGVGLISAGTQNPVAYWNGAGSLEVTMQSFRVLRQDGSAMTHAEMTERLVAEREPIRSAHRAARPERRSGGVTTDAEMRRSIHDLKRFLSDPAREPDRPAL